MTVDYFSLVAKLLITLRLVPCFVLLTVGCHMLRHFLLCSCDTVQTVIRCWTGKNTCLIYLECLIATESLAWWQLSSDWLIKKQPIRLLQWCLRHRRQDVQQESWTRLLLLQRMQHPAKCQSDKCSVHRNILVFYLYSQSCKPSLNIWNEIILSSY